MASPETWTELLYFRPEEFTFPHEMDDVLLLTLDKARRYAGQAFIITNSYRDPDSDIGVPDSAHKKGMAVDIRANDSRTRYNVLRGLLAAGFQRIGVYDKHLHADVDASKPTGVVWIGTSV